MTEQWSVLATLTPTEYAQFRGALGNSSGFQSVQYRAVEFVLGNKNGGMLAVFADEPAAHALLARAAAAHRACTTSSCACSPGSGYAVPGRDPRPRRDRSLTCSTPRWCRSSAEIYDDTAAHWDVYEACEELVDLEDNFQLWRFRHLQTVKRTIGIKTGTGGSSGVDFLPARLDLTFFPELYAVRTLVGS